MSTGPTRIRLVGNQRLPVNETVGTLYMKGTASITAGTGRGANASFVRRSAATTIDWEWAVTTAMLASLPQAYDDDNIDVYYMTSNTALQSSDIDVYDHTTGFSRGYLHIGVGYTGGEQGSRIHVDIPILRQRHRDSFLQHDFRGQVHPAGPGQFLELHKGSKRQLEQHPSEQVHQGECRRKRLGIRRCRRGLHKPRRHSYYVHGARREVPGGKRRSNGGGVRGQSGRTFQRIDSKPSGCQGSVGNSGTGKSRKYHPLADFQGSDSFHFGRSHSIPSGCQGSVGNSGTGKSRKYHKVASEQAACRYRLHRNPALYFCGRNETGRNSCWCRSKRAARLECHYRRRGDPEQALRW